MFNEHLLCVTQVKLSHASLTQQTCGERDTVSQPPTGFSLGSWLVFCRSITNSADDGTNVPLSPSQDF